MKKRIKRWKKRLLIILGSFLGVIIILGIIFNQIVYLLIFELGYIDVHNGNNERGNKIMSYTISKMKNPSETVFHALSVQNTKNGNYNISIPALEKAYGINPKEVGAYYGWVLLYYYHDYEKALSILNKYDDSTPNFSDWPMGECIHYLKGLAYMQLTDYEDAIKEFDVSIENTSMENGEDWVNYEVFLNKGRCLKELGRYEDAILSYQKAIRNFDKSSGAYYFMGLSQIELNQKEKACQNFSKALELIKKGYKSSDIYVELFHEIYERQVEQSVLKNCVN